jgi:AhpD family alkylhydroperoxidase
MESIPLNPTQPESPPQRFMKRLYCPKDFYRFLADMVASLGDMRQGKNEELVSEEFSERIMLAVTEVNGCRYCSYFHTQVALKAGLAQDEIRDTLDGNLSNAPEEEIPALLFAQHYAEAAGRPEAEMSERLVEIYGERRARAIVARIRGIMVGNAWGNAFDSLRFRLKGQPNPDMSLGNELGTIFGPIFMLPVIAVRRLWMHNQR